MKILIIRNDKLGDFILSFPVYKFIKENMPEAEIHALVPDYTRPLAEFNPYIDFVITESEKDSSLSSQLKLLKNIRSKKFDAVITLFSTTRVGILTFLSGISYRLAPATKIAQIFYNKKLTQRRSKSLKPEYQYNLDLASRFLTDFNINKLKDVTYPYMAFPTEELTHFKKSYCLENNLDPETEIIIIHPGTGGSANNIKLSQYAELIDNLETKATFILCAGPGESEQVIKLAEMISNKKTIIYHSVDGILKYSKLIACARLFISASTGPLHIAGALNIPTAAFYQRRRSATPLRWQTLNSEQNRIAFTPPENVHESDLHAINVTAAAKQINDKYFSS